MELHSRQTLEALCPQYRHAWNTDDVHATQALYTDSSLSHLHAGARPVEGNNAVRTAFSASLAQWPGVHFDPQDIRLVDQHATVGGTVIATLAAPLAIALQDQLAQANR